MEQLIIAIKQVFAKMKSEYCSVFDMGRKLIWEEGLTAKEANQAISLARAKQEIGMIYPPKRELCYQLLTEENRKNLERLISAVRKVFEKTKKEYRKVDEMKQQLLEEGLTPEQVEQAISLAEANDVLQWCKPYTDEISGEPSYRLVTEGELRLKEKEEEEELRRLEKEFQKKKERRIRKKTTKEERSRLKPHPNNKKTLT